MIEYSEETIVPDKDLSLQEGAIEPWSKPAAKWWYRQFAKFAGKYGINLKVPYKKLPEEVKILIFKGSPDLPEKTVLIRVEGGED